MGKNHTSHCSLERVINLNLGVFSPADAMENEILNPCDDIDIKDEDEKGKGKGKKKNREEEDDDLSFAPLKKRASSSSSSAKKTHVRGAHTRKKRKSINKEKEEVGDGKTVEPPPVQEEATFFSAPLTVLHDTAPVHAHARAPPPVQKEMRLNNQRHKIYLCTDHDTTWFFPPVSYAIAPSVEEGMRVLDQLLSSQGLQTSRQHPYTLQEVPTHSPQAQIVALTKLRAESGKTEMESIATPLHMFTCVNHAMHPPLPPVAYCIATSVEEATHLLDAKLSKYKLETSTKKPYTLKKVELTHVHAHTLNFGKM